MTKEQYDIIKNKPGFIAALDQSGGSTPKALLAYGVEDSQYDNEDKMFDLVHEMRTRIITSPAFTSDHIIGAILFEQTIDRKINGKFTGEYLTDQGIVPFLKVDKGLAPEENGVQLMKPIPNLNDTLRHANERGIFGTKMRSNILEYNEEGIKEIVRQQFEVGKQIVEAGLIPILEPEVNIHAENKVQIEKLLKEEILKELNQLADDEVIMLKLTIPTEANTYKELIDHPQVLRVVALSGGYSTSEANEKLSKNEGLIASFSRALSQDLNVNQSDDEFNQALSHSVESIYRASNS